MAKVYSIEGVVPVIHPEAFVHPTAVLIGDAVVAAGCYVGPGASMRGDFGTVELKAGSNLQDNCIMHSFPSTACVVEEAGHIGHGAVLHGCTVRPGGMVGMGAVVMDGAVIGEDAMVAACAFVSAGTVVEPRTLVGGIPAKTLRALKDSEIDWKRRGTAEYQELTRRCLASFAEAQPLSEREPDRPKVLAGDYKPLAQSRKP
jgi:phenylacetic acid degradation protein